MQTIQDLKKTIDSTEDLQSVVKTMKSLAAVNIRQFERAVESLQDYYRTIELGLTAALSSTTVLPREHQGRARRHGQGLVVFGSDQGMCGQLNEQVASLAMETLDHSPDKQTEARLLAVGERVAVRLEDAGGQVAGYLPVPTSVTAIGGKVREILEVIDEWQADHQLERVFLLFCVPTSGSRFEATKMRLLPFDRQWFLRYRQVQWPTRNLPQFSAHWPTLFTSLVRQYLFVSLFRAFASSLASENASRLAAMQGAERNIKERLEELSADYNQLRQMSITSELLDIVSGFEALR
ncbi:F0F1 ATP synthase subunit gamma [Desulfofustis glycolicus]|uniref:F-type H+-transporting ATPase subunit gamma n=1 Tax=Desulfofustis glycolicus DSM 9705 TaxID=1121409 RepID=A0A1M5SJD3_9BACT|nr:F0F1 ATP synthase subunit gamma [Desulfofustis glycolicus]MCB2215774.1 F0F1 ATP synthase subunit gamma [Desulfobulbaceae bacterium]SHH38674.1 F-type H+-transporting ATPase subunit gamma [Desulfofustis glycolicus DSM 9705]